MLPPTPITPFSADDADIAADFHFDLPCHFCAYSHARHAAVHAIFHFEPRRRFMLIRHD